MKLLTVEKNTTEHSTYWFRAYSRSDFKEYLKITSYLETAAWAASYYELLSEKNHKRLTKNKVEEFANRRVCNADPRAWHTPTTWNTSHPGKSEHAEHARGE